MLLFYLLQFIIFNICGAMFSAEILTLNAYLKHIFGKSLYYKSKMMLFISQFDLQPKGLKAMSLALYCWVMTSEDGGSC